MSVNTRIEDSGGSRLLLACGIVAGPIYVGATLAQALTREGFDIWHHRFTWLTIGELGWIHQANMMLAGALTILFAFGVARHLQTGHAAAWAPWLIALFGLAYFVGGTLTADPVAGFPPGTTVEAVTSTVQGNIQNASRGVSTVLLLASCIAVAAAFAAEGRRVLAAFTIVLLPIAAGGIVAAGVAMGVSSYGLAFLATPWIWTTGVAVILFWRGG